MMQFYVMEEKYSDRSFSGKLHKTLSSELGRMFLEGIDYMYCTVNWERCICTFFLSRTKQDSESMCTSGQGQLNQKHPPPF